MIAAARAKRCFQPATRGCSNAFIYLSIAKRLFFHQEKWGVLFNITVIQCSVLNKRWVMKAGRIHIAKSTCGCIKCNNKCLFCFRH